MGISGEKHPDHQLSKDRKIFSTHSCQSERPCGSRALALLVSENSVSVPRLARRLGMVRLCHFHNETGTGYEESNHDIVSLIERNKISVSDFQVGIGKTLTSRSRFHFKFPVDAPKS